MSVTTEAAYYDEHMTAGDAPAMLDLQLSPWRPLYEEAARWIPRNHPVVDLGCGTGRFLRALERADHDAARHGIDFSPAAIDAAAAYLTTSRNELTVGDLRDWRPDPDRAGNTSYTCLEVLEHLDDDRALVRQVPPGHQFVFSVPSYDSEAHLRVFKNVGDVFARYDRLLSLRRWSLIDLGGRVVHVCDSVRRSDSW